MSQSSPRKIQVNPKSGSEWIHAGMLAYRAKKYEVALKCMNQAIQLEPKVSSHHTNIGVIFKTVGDMVQAEKAYREALALNPKDSEAYNNLANTLYAKNELDEAKELLEQAIALRPNFYHSLNTLGIIYFRKGDLQKSYEMLRATLKAKPDFSLAMKNLGNVFLAQHNLTAALKWYNKSLKLSPNERSTILLKAKACLMLGRFEEIESLCNRAEKYGPTDAGIHILRAQVCEHKNEYQSAKTHFQKALELGGNSPSVHHKLGAVLFQQLENIPEAEMHFKKALEADPHHQETLFYISSLYIIDGKHDLAEANLKKLLSINSDHAQGYRLLAHIKKTDSDDGPTIAQMEAMIASDALSDNKVTDLHYALADALDHKSRYSEAFVHLKKANDRDDTRHTFDKDGLFRKVRELKEVFNKDFFAQRKDYGSYSELPVFIVGMPRSGTTLTEQIIATHPSVHGAGELKQIGAIRNRLSDYSPEKRTFPFSALDISYDDSKIISNKHIEYLQSMSPDSVRVTDKMPFNLFSLGLMALLFPRAKFIYCKRNALDNCLSCYFVRFVEKMTFSTNLENLGHMYLAHEEVMKHWQEVLPQNILEVNYEETIANQEEQSKKLLETVNLDWDERCLEYYKTERPIRTASNWQVRQPLYNSSVARWKNYEKELEPLRKIIAAGYPI
ncbi:MAG: tetratricopeptide repeat protein [Planctomycetes bacterium]|nr:tetratricopeptide repeat protein [Planctomycetota bacterium]